eukprot:scaffold119116_cov60-Phaeocystis_antarctica.AAC.2
MERVGLEQFGSLEGSFFGGIGVGVPKASVWRRRNAASRLSGCYVRHPWLSRALGWLPPAAPA